MKTSFSFQPKLHVASLEAQSDWHELRIHTLLQDPSQKQPSINAYLGARYSRSADSIVSIAEEVMNKGTDASKRLETIFQNYGHKSVGDMADLFLCLENVPMITAMRLFYLNPVLAGQERSTRFQNFENPDYIKLPKNLKLPAKLRQEYDDIIHQHLADYRRLLPKTEAFLAEHFKADLTKGQHRSALQARTFDTVRYFLPMGLQTSLGYVMSARNWSELIGWLRASGNSIERDLGEMVFELLAGMSKKVTADSSYLPEADGLIRHTEANYNRQQTTEAVLKLLKKERKQTLNSNPPSRTTRHFSIGYQNQALQNLVRHYQLLLNPRSKYQPTLLKKLVEKYQEPLAKIFFKNHNQHNQIGPTAQSGSIAIEGWADFGILKDLNRHRSFERFVPIWQDEIDMAEELNRSPEKSFFLCDYLYLPGAEKLRAEYKAALTTSYQRIQKWFDDTKKHLEPAQRTEYTRYLLPHAHATRYRFYGSVDDLQYLLHLRTRNGGHIAYRHLTYKWLEKFAAADPFWKVLLKKIPEVDAKSREQFFDRS